MKLLVDNDREVMLPPGVRPIRVDGVRDLSLRCLVTDGKGEARRPAVILLHGFPELAYSWRHTLEALGAAGYFAVAPDLRGYGGTRSQGGPGGGGPARSGMLNLVEDVLALAARLNQRKFIVVGHDFGSPLAAWTALTRPDLVTAAVLMSAPFAGAPTTLPAPGDPEDQALAGLVPPRRHYKRYFCEPTTEGELRNCPQGVSRFLRAYFHMKSADWPLNTPFPLRNGDAAELARLPPYYVMPRDQDMPAMVAPHEPPADRICTWLPPDALAVYAAEFSVNGFQGGLDWYRAARDPEQIRTLIPFARRRIAVPVMFVAGEADWGVHQTAGAFAAMRTDACADFRGAHLLPGAGHWVQQERPSEVHRLLLEFLREVC